jgi:hypothetical protein
MLFAVTNGKSFTGLLAGGLSHRGAERGALSQLVRAERDEQIVPRL